MRASDMREAIVGRTADAHAVVQGLDMYRICTALFLLVAACDSDDRGEFPVAPGGSTSISGRAPGTPDAGTLDAGVGDAGLDDGGLGDAGLGPDASGSIDAPLGLPDAAGGSLDAPL
jgi:hypothetical protein